MNLQDLVETAIAGGKLKKEEIEVLRGELANFRTAESLATKASDLVKDGNLLIPNGEPGREACLKWWDAAQTWRGWRTNRREEKS